MNSFPEIGPLSDPRDAEPDVEQVRCDECGGHGDVMDIAYPDYADHMYTQCDACKGRGYVTVRR